MSDQFNIRFEEFAEAVKATGAINKWPQIGDGQDVITYSVYLNGPVAEKLPHDLQDHEFKDVMLHALTEKLSLNPDSPRDNLKVGELVAMRHAWMTEVLNHSVARDQQGDILPISDAVRTDYETLTQGFTHPWIRKQLEEQKQLSQGLKPALDNAAAIVGNPLKDNTPDVVSKGVVVSQNTQFTIQAIKDGDYVTHENRRLNKLPEVGQEVMVSYYRGQGQVLPAKDLQISNPFIDNKTQDLGVRISDSNGKVQQVVLFNGLSSYAKFVASEGLDKGLIVKAIEAREAHPKDKDRSTNIEPDSQFLAARFNNLITNNPKLAENPKVLDSLIGAVEKKMGSPEKDQVKPANKPQSMER